MTPPMTSPMTPLMTPLMTSMPALDSPGPDASTAVSTSPGAEPGGAAGAPRVQATARTYLRARRGWRAVDLGELWHARELVWIFMMRDVKVRYKQTLLGLTWAVVVPVVQVLVFTVVFGSLLGVGARVNRAAGRDLPYPLFALTGQLVWNFFKMAIDGASMSLLANTELVRKIYIPRLVLPFAAVGKPAMDTALAFLLMIGLTAWYAMQGQVAPPSPGRLVLGLAFSAGAVLPALGGGLIVAAITVSYRDLQHVLPLFTSLLFFATPVIYSVEVLPPRFAWTIYLNPVAGFVQANRAAVLNLPFDWTGIATSAALSVLLLVGGLFYFARTERRFADMA